MRETKVEEHLRTKAKAAGALVRKMVWPGHNGAPDRLIIWSSQRGDRIGYPSQIDFVELKRPGGKLDEHQIREHNRLRGMGCAVFTLDSIEAVDRYIRERTSA